MSLEAQILALRAELALQAALVIKQQGQIEDATDALGTAIVATANMGAALQEAIDNHDRFCDRPTVCDYKVRWGKALAGRTGDA